ncbi:hypothetical protein VUR80DRAFT_9204 [Thermomyces stellatus]
MNNLCVSFAPLAKITTICTWMDNTVPFSCSNTLHLQNLVPSCNALTLWLALGEDTARLNCFRLKALIEGVSFKSRDTKFHPLRHPPIPRPFTSDGKQGHSFAL